MEQRRELRFGDRFVEHIGAAVVGEEALHRGMKLEPADAEIADQAARLAGAGLALRGVDARERDQHVAVSGSLLGDLLIGVAAVAGLALGIDREDHRADLAFAVVARRLLDGRAIVGLVEINRHLRLQLVVAVVGMRSARLLGVGVDIDRDEFVAVHDTLPEGLGIP